MIACPNCKKMVSNEAVKCPNCQTILKQAPTDTRACKTCKSLVDANKYSSVTTSSYLHEGSTHYTRTRFWTPCPNCGDPKWGERYTGRTIVISVILGLVVLMIMLMMQTCSSASDSFNALTH